MKALLFATCLAGCAVLSAPAWADSSSQDAPVGKQAGTFMVRLRAIDVIPENNASSTSIGGHVHANDQFAPEADTVLGRVTAKTSLDPLVAGMGVGYRF